MDFSQMAEKYMWETESNKRKGGAGGLLPLNISKFYSPFVLGCGSLWGINHAAHKRNYALLDADWPGQTSPR